MTLRTHVVVLVAAAALVSCGGGHAAQDQSSPTPTDVASANPVVATSPAVPAAAESPAAAASPDGSPGAVASDAGASAPAATSPEGASSAAASPGAEASGAAPAPASAAAVTPAAVPAASGPAGAATGASAVGAASAGGAAGTSGAAGASSASPTATPAPTATPVPTPSPTPTIVPNLLSFGRGTFISSWSVGSSNYGAESLAIGNAWGTNGTSTATPELVFELPAVAAISQLSVNATMPAATSAEVQFAAATANDRDFTDAGSIALKTTEEGQATGVLQRAISARWLRVRFVRPRGVNVRIESLVADGTLDVPTPQSLEGRWLAAESPTGSGDVVFAPVKGAVPTAVATPGGYQIATASLDGGFAAAPCNYDRPVWRGPLENGLARLGVGGTLTIVANGSLLVGIANGEPIFARRMSRAPACDAPPSGNGPVTAIFARHPESVGDASDVADPSTIPGHRFERHFLPLMTAGQLAHASAAVLGMSCDADHDSAASQQRALLDFVRAGHVLVIRDADTCPKSSYAFVPYPFTTSATGAAGQRGHVLSIADSSQLASSDASDKAHFIDTQAYLASQGQQIGDADIMTTTDQHWCGLMFAKNATGTSGWVRAYARYGRGIIVYDGFDVDDLRGRIPQAILLNRLAYGLSPNADLPCNAHVASRLLLLSSVRRTIPFGTARDLKIRFTLDHEGVTTPERVTLSVDGERAPGWRASLDRHAITLGGNDQSLVASIHVPANATATEHLYTVTATGEAGRVARASIQFDVNEALAKELEKGRARIYGIHFDVASDRIQPQSEATIREIAQVLRGHATWRMRVEGYTDSDGGAAYNLDLSRRRARSVVHDLTAHYGIAAARLRSEGYGLTHPVASNATDGGKALNRRVELVRL